MKLPSFLKFLKPDKSHPLSIDPDEFIPTLWEDDFCQIEIVPCENKEFIITQSQGISDLAEKSKSGLGFSETFERGSMPFPTLSKEIRADYLEYFFSGFELPKAKQIRYETSEIIDCRNGKTKAFGYSNFTIFFEKEDEFAKNIWLSVGLFVSVKQFELIKSVLYSLGEENELVLIDWNSLELTDLRDRRQIDEYLSGHRK